MVKLAMASSVRIPLGRFYMTPPMPCPYLEGRVERKVFTQLQSGAKDSQQIHEALAVRGFRRSHNIVYKPLCEGCSACVPVRVHAPTFSPSRSQCRVLRINNDLTAEAVPVVATSEHFGLFQRYQTTRHAEGDMAIMSVDEYRAMVEESPIETILIEYRGGGDQLVGVSLTDRMGDGLSMVYSFFDPAQPRRSPGTAMILQHIAQACAEDLDYLYLGYWISDSPKMAYKSRFQPLEALGPTGWEVMTPGVAQQST
jgi:arginyl-tRNA--protein-N-Asp/Glu arginylyltransferase